MLNIITNRDLIKQYQTEFKKIFIRHATYRKNCHLGYKGGYQKECVYWFSKPSFWAAFDMAENRFWNPFGVDKPSSGKLLNITCEINFPFKGIDRRIGGTFATDEAGKIYIVHRGKIGGGRKGVGKQLFINNYYGKRNLLIDGEEKSEVAIIGELGDKRLIFQIGNFVHEVERIKKITYKKGQKLIKQKLSTKYSDEFTGKRNYLLNRRISSQADHGIIVKRLASELESLGYRCANDRNRDLYILNKHNILSTIFEVKTDFFTNSIYSVIGQLTYHSIPLKKECEPNLIAVLPHETPRAIIENIKILGIQTLKYKWINNKVQFINLSACL